MVSQNLLFDHLPHSIHEKNAASFASRQQKRLGQSEQSKDFPVALQNEGPVALNSALSSELNRADEYLDSQDALLTPSLVRGISDPYERDAITKIVDRLRFFVRQARDELTDEAVENFVRASLPADPLKDVRIAIESDNLELRSQFLTTEVCLTSQQVHERAGMGGKNRSQITWRWKTDKKIFAVNWGGKDLFAAFQFDDSGKPLPVIAKALKVLRDGGMADWPIALWWITANSWLNDAAPIDLLNQARDEAIIDAASHEIEPVYY